jgi:predicted porin
MRKILLGTTALLGVGAIAGNAQASDGIKLDVGGFFQTVYQGVFDRKSDGHFGNHRNVDRLIHNAEVHFKGETTLDNGLTVGAQIELEGETSNGDQIDKSFVYWSGGFGRVSVGTQDGPIAACPVFPPGATANFSGFSPASWGSNDPIGSNTVCTDVLSDVQAIKYTTPNFAGFQLVLAYSPNAGAVNYNVAGVNGAGTPNIFPGTATHNFGGYLTYGYAGDGWGVDWGGGFSRFGKIRGCGGFDGCESISSIYQSALTVTFGNFAVGAIGAYYDNGGDDNNAWVAGGGASYGVDAWTLGIQGSHGTYAAGNGGGGDNGGATLNRIILTGSYELAPGVLLDSELGYTWFKNTADGIDDGADNYSAFDVGVGSKLTF